MVKNKKNTNRFTEPEPGHFVQFYQSDLNLILSLVEYIGSGLSSDETCIVIATKPHMLALNDQLILHGIDVDEARHTGQYIVLDAAETLEKFMINDLPNRSRFFDVIGAMLRDSALKGKPIRAYGEMVALLWKRGNKEAVIQLENLWNELIEKYSVSLYCAYPALHFIFDKEVQTEIHACHNGLLSSLS
ncbi:MEDS domain-containing protein [Candidatus Saccharibacteria bacterium]|nr:MEDS domain-containing protein [Candidatus Saccharibacteria bacterium]